MTWKFVIVIALLGTGTLQVIIDKMQKGGIGM